MIISDVDQNKQFVYNSSPDDCFIPAKIEQVLKQAAKGASLSLLTSRTHLYVDEDYPLLSKNTEGRCGSVNTNLLSCNDGEGEEE